ncbi:hypothetical protein CLU90_4003 [Janthinobacterium sp. 67]|uniref:hypothetical protein n=1 Tax=Janthinobacterium sp. 67 TaxID=2035207 RepID=UPI000CC703E4|nr:hypothetical protein [Janthinobacterium sp. 67]PJJ20742.1 hypothetical protein CLU90_4003 [Janthinobacterium sp. 67]
MPVLTPVAAQLYCVPFSGSCRTMAEWAVYWQALGVVAAVLFGVFGLYKIYHELKRLNEQRSKDQHDKETSAKLKRTEFFLNQHRRLFDDEILYSVLCLLDADKTELAKEEMWDAKRKFLAFIEEIALLVCSEQINKDVAMNMFGYYARCARYGKNFVNGINPAREHWSLFYWFTDEADKFAQQYPDGPPKLTL